MDDHPLTSIGNALQHLAKYLESVRNSDVAFFVVVLWLGLVLVLVFRHAVKVITTRWQTPRVPKKALPSPTREEQLQNAVETMKEEFDLEASVAESVELEDQEDFFVRNALRRKMMRRLFQLFDIQEEER